MMRGVGPVAYAGEYISGAYFFRKGGDTNGNYQETGQLVPD